MQEQGFVVQSSVSDQHGIIHAGGTSANSFLSFSFDDCDAAVQPRLSAGDIPPNPNIAVTFDVAFQNGSLVAVNIH